MTKATEKDFLDKMEADEHLLYVAMAVLQCAFVKTTIEWAVDVEISPQDERLPAIFATAIKLIDNENPIDFFLNVKEHALWEIFVQDVVEKKVPK